ncbi:hypothetical protein [Micromonospora sp.]|uniref:hypothetical protein n=1 Tax=Micromonospora sp. TaxID=1876 RepID=UPI003B3ACABE
MTSDASFPDLIADRACTAARSMIAEMDSPPSAAMVDQLVQRSVQQAFGCTCPRQDTDDPAGPKRNTCLLHGRTQHLRSLEESIMPSQATSWENDPYTDYTSTEWREDVQAKLRAATEFSRTFRNDLTAVVQRGQMAQEQLEDAIEHASFNGGLHHSELERAEMALSALQYALRQLYAASNHVGDQPGAGQHS